MVDSLLKNSNTILIVKLSMEKVKYPDGEKLIAGKTSVLACIDFDRFMDEKTPEKIIQCKFFNTQTGKEKLVDLFRPNRDFRIYLRDFNIAACSLQSM